MLYLGDGPRHVRLDETRGLYVYPDYSDPKRFYYLPANPHVSDGPDGKPAVRLLLLREDLTTGAAEDDLTGFLLLDVDLSWNAKDLERAAMRLMVDANLSDLPVLLPLDYRRGTVRFLLLDQVTPPPDEAKPEAPPSRFVTRTLQVGHPSLYGDCRAIFQAEVTKRGAALLTASVGGMMPIGVIYELTYAGLQPAFQVKANVDWDKVVEHFSENYGFNSIFLHTDISKSIDKLVDDRAISIEVVVEGVGAEAMDGDREAVMAAVRELVFNTFFSQTFKPPTAAGDSTADDVMDVISGVRRALNPFGSFGYERKEVRIEEVRKLDIDWTARKAAERTIFPQAHIFSLLGGAGLTRLNDLVTTVDLADFHTSQTIDLLANAAWKEDGIASISVEIQYDDATSDGPTVVHHRSAQLTADAPRSQLRERVDRADGGRFRYRYQVVFTPEGVPGPAALLSSGDAWREHQGFVLTLDPRELFDSGRVNVFPVKGFPFDRWPAVQVFLRHRSADGAFTFEKDVVLDGTATMDARYRTVPGGGTNELRLRYLGATGRVIEQPWFPLENQQWVVTDPEPKFLDVTAVVSGDRTQILNLLVDLEYRDEAAGIAEEGHLSFTTENLAVPQKWRVNIDDPTRRRYRYRMTLVAKNGDFIQSGWIGTDAPTIPVGDVYVRTLSVEAITGTLGKDVDSVVLAVTYDDDANGIHAGERYTLASNARVEWRLMLKDASRRSWSYTLTWRLRSGFEVTVGPTMTTDSFLAIPPLPPEGR